MSFCYVPPPRKQVSFERAQTELVELSDEVVKNDLELVLTRDGKGDVVLIHPHRLQHYHALEASICHGTAPDKSDLGHQEAPGLPSVAIVEQDRILLAAEYWVADTRVSPREVHERYILELELPTFEEPCDITVRVADEQLPETFLATWGAFQRGRLSISAAILRAYCTARFGAPDLPTPVDDYGVEFNQVVLTISERKPHEVRPPIFLLSVGGNEAGWTVSWSKRGASMPSQHWKLERSHFKDPLHLLWHAAAEVDTTPFTSLLADGTELPHRGPCQPIT